MEILFLKTVLPLLIVLALMYLALKLVKKYMNPGLISNKGNNSLVIENVTYIDQHNKLVNFSNKLGTNYIISIGQNHSFLVDKYKIGKDE
jgi:hypothetical protein